MNNSINNSYMNINCMKRNGLVNDFTPLLRDGVVDDFKGSEPLLYLLLRSRQNA